MARRISQVQQQDRNYPGQSEAATVLAYFAEIRRVPNQLRRYAKKRALEWTAESLEFVRDSELKPFVDHIRRLQGIPSRNALTWPVDRATRKTVQPVIDALMREVDKHGASLQFDSEKGRWSLGPGTLASQALLSLLQLWSMGRLNRIKQCQHCKEWFYARFVHQVFCSDKSKRCQWNDYHTSEWRTRNRERNRRHQAEYRKRTFGREAIDVYL